MRLVAFILIALSFAVYAENDYCFYTNVEGEKYHSIYRAEIKAEFARIIHHHVLNKTKSETFYRDLKHDWRTNCLSLEASGDIKGFLDSYHAKRSHEFTKITHPTGLNKCVLFVAATSGKPPFKRVLLKYPEEKQITLLDESKLPINVQVLLVAENIVQYTVNYKGKNYTFYRGVNSSVELLHVPYFDEELTKLIDAHKKVTLLSGELLHKDNNAFFAVTCK